MTPVYPPNMSQLQDSGMFATVGPELRGLPGYVGHAAALDHHGGVVDGSCVEMFVLDHHGNPPTSVTKNTSLVPLYVNQTGDALWSACGEALPVSHQDLNSFTRPWHTVG